MINWFKNLSKKEKKNIIIFSIICLLIITFLVIGIVFTVLGHDEYSIFVGEQKNYNDIKTANPNAEISPPSFSSITLFTYGIFGFVMFLLTSIAAAFFGNSIFNKKYKEQK